MTIGEAARLSGLSQRMIRHYESIALVPAPERRQSGYRDYSDSDVHRLVFVRRARDLGFALDDIRQLLMLWQDRSRASSDVKELALKHAAELKTKADQLESMRQSLLDLAASCHGDDRPDCPILAELAAGDNCH